MSEGVFYLLGSAFVGFSWGAYVMEWAMRRAGWRLPNYEYEQLGEMVAQNAASMRLQRKVLGDGYRLLNAFSVTDPKSGEKYYVSVTEHKPEQVSA